MSVKATRAAARGRAASLIVACAALAACAGPTSGEIDARTLDATTYTSHVHPLLEPSCATLDCHGGADRPLRLYAETGLRIDGALRAMESPLSDAEASANVAALAGLDPELPPERSQILLKPLATRAGGMHHVGGDLWPSRDDDAFVCVLAWLGGTLGDVERSSCDRAAAAVALPPPD